MQFEYKDFITSKLVITVIKKEVLYKKKQKCFKKLCGMMGRCVYICINNNVLHDVVLKFKNKKYYLLAMALIYSQVCKSVRFVE